MKVTEGGVLEEQEDSTDTHNNLNNNIINNNMNSDHMDDHSVASSTQHHPDIEEIGVDPTSSSSSSLLAKETRGLMLTRVIAIVLFLMAGAGIAAGMHVLLIGENEKSFEGQVRSLSLNDDV